MKAGDLVIMVGELIAVGDNMSVGLVVEDCLRYPGDNTRIGVMWFDSDCVDYEPKDWLEVISESR